MTAFKYKIWTGDEMNKMGLDRVS